MDINDLIQKRIFSACDELAERKSPEDLYQYRGHFQRDRDRILYSKSFRRLSGKTQVFLSRSNDHIRNRLTHSLEVNQIAGTTAKALGLDSELTEAISLGHDIGHTPFGHVGERVLNHIMNNCIDISRAKHDLGPKERGFKHNLQGVRVFSDLHYIYPYFDGTNLTNFTLYGIYSHSSKKYKQCKEVHEQICYRKKREDCPRDGSLSVDFYNCYSQETKIRALDKTAWSFEAQVVRIADEIAQRHHDVEDAILLNILTPSDIIGKITDCFKHILTSKDNDKLDYAAQNEEYFATLISKFLVNMYNTDLILNSITNLELFAKENEIANKTDFRKSYEQIAPDYVADIISFSEDFSKGDECFQKFLGSTILNSNKAQRMDGKGSYIIEQLFKAYYENPRQLHDSTIIAVFNMFEQVHNTVQGIGKIKLGKYRDTIGKASLRSDPRFETCLMRAICDHIAGMTDNFVIDEFMRLYGDKPI